ncbi:TolC family outer membrane protein [Caldimonas tepidiphila]|uniref:TolC family outer membrane protein n=1 Tax=Caldimonas tepidiphila TaxID=2315841 RepID=UPI000E5A84ED|nr:TolC family outer membrane protein [Caldimonas tepidiphila]
MPRLKLLSIASALLCCGAALAQQASDPLQLSTQKAIVTNPEVTARFHAFQAADHEIGVARGAYYPRLDVNANLGRTRDRTDLQPSTYRGVSYRGAGLSVTQLLWDGFATRKEVGRLGHVKNARYFEFVDVSEQTALEAARAYYDVLRYRQLVQQAEDNYVQHKVFNDQIESRFKAGVGRGVDVDQAGARLALAESNLATELANLHDVNARYQRIVGEAPPPAAALGPLLKEGLPGNAQETVAQALARNAAISAAIENLRAARAQAEGQRGTYQPRLEARARTSTGENLNGNIDQQRDVTAELVLNWNLFNGGSDRARSRQLADLIAQAADVRDRTCREVRQTAAIAHHDTDKLGTQLRYLARNMAAIERARDSYRQQFEIGQRSLLDLLNAQNEVYTSRRAYANAAYDLHIAYARAQAALNSLTGTLGLSRVDTGAAIETGWSAGEDAAERCPVVDSTPTATPLAELDARAKAQAEARAAGSQPQPAPPATRPQ